MPMFVTARWAMCSARSPLRSSWGRIKRTPTRWRSVALGSALDVEQRPDQELDLRSQVVDRLVALHDRHPESDVVAQQGFCGAGQRL